MGIPIIEGANRIAGFLGSVISPVKEEIHHAPLSVELSSMGLSIAIVIIGILIAYTVYLFRKELAQKLFETFPRIHKLIYNKYYVDEIYGAVFVEPIKNTSFLLWRLWDDKVIDGAVNGAGKVTRTSGRIFRLIQTGNIRQYALFVLFGTIIILYVVVR